MDERRRALVPVVVVHSPTDELFAGVRSPVLIGISYNRYILRREVKGFSDFSFDISSRVFGSLRTQTYFRLSLVSAENNVCEPEPGNDFGDLMTFVSPWPIRFHDRMKLKCSQRIPRLVVLGLLELNCDWLKIPTSQKSFPGSGSQTFIFGGDKRQPEYVCVRRLHVWKLSFTPLITCHE